MMDDIQALAELIEAYGKLSKRSQGSWIWWRLPAPPARTSIFADLVEDEPHGVAVDVQMDGAVKRALGAKR